MALTAGGLHGQLGDLDAAEASLARAQALLDELLAESPDDVQAALSLAAVYKPAGAPAADPRSDPGRRSHGRGEPRAPRSARPRVSRRGRAARVAPAHGRGLDRARALARDRGRSQRGRRGRGAGDRAPARPRHPRPRGSAGALRPRAIARSPRAHRLARREPGRPRAGRRGPSSERSGSRTRPSSSCATSSRRIPRSPSRASAWRARSPIRASSTPGLGAMELGQAASEEAADVLGELFRDYPRVPIYGSEPRPDERQPRRLPRRARRDGERGARASSARSRPSRRYSR